VLDAADNEQALTGHIDGHRPDLLDPSGGTVLDVPSTPTLPAAGGTWVSLPRRPAAGVPTPPALDGTDEPVSAIDMFGTSCTAGAIGSCILHADGALGKAMYN
jgi:hypothetical protein